MDKLRKNIAISDSGYVFDPSTGESYTLNPIGLEIVGMLKQNIHDDEIKSRIQEKYEVDGSTLERYYWDFIAMLKNYQLTENE